MKQALFSIDAVLFRSLIAFFIAIGTQRPSSLITFVYKGFSETVCALCFRAQVIKALNKVIVIHPKERQKSWKQKQFPR